MTENTTRVHSLIELQAILSDQIDKIASDETTPAKVNAVVNATATILRTVKMQMDYHKMIGRNPEIPLLMTGEDKKK
jgi:C4-dicarboxylate-specific signal transduction histidine kinase